LTDLLAEFDRLRREHDRWLLNQAKEADQQRRKHDQWLLDQAKEVDRLRRKHDQWLLENAKRDTQKLAQGAQALGQKAAKESVNATKDTFATITTGKPHGDIAIGATKAGKDVGRALDKFHNDTVAEVGRFGSNLDELVQAVVHAVEDELANAMRNMTDAAKRISEGKVIDALWHSAVDPAKGSSKNWAKAATDSSYLNAVGQTVATVYGGGAGGAAAYAAWLTYEQTGDFEAAIKQGIISGATTYASAGASEIPADAKRIVTKAAITAAAVAVNGGSEEDMKKGALIAGGVVILQVAYREYTGTELDPSPSKGDALCKQSPGADCAPSPAAYDEDGKLDKRKLSPEEKTRPQVGVGAAKGQAGMALETSKTMTTISRVPVMNAMALGHDIFVDDVHRITGLDGQTLDMVSKATIVPAMVIAYTAGGAPVYTFVQEVGIKHHRQNNAE